jgi:FkbM family methyltransferase
MNERAEVWEQVRAQYPEFTPAHDVLDNYHAVREIVLGGSAAWAEANRRFSPFAGARVMDIGANAGIYSAMCGARGARVDAYEPHPLIYHLLEQMVVRTHLWEHISCFRSAVWTKSGLFPFLGHKTPADAHVPADRYNGGLFCAGVPHVEAEREAAREAICTSLEHAIGPELWDCIKMDIEGAEFEVLLATPEKALRQVRFMFVELHPWASQELYDETLKRMGSIFQMDARYPDQNGRIQALYLTRD